MRLSLALCLALALSAQAQTSPDPIVETRVDQVRQQHGLTGDGVIVCILDRGLDVTHADFRHPDGTTRVLGIFDLLLNQTFTRAQIDAALSGGTPLAHRDAVGHGTATTGIAAGNGAASSGTYTGPATEADLLVIKFTSEGAPAHDGEPAEAPFYFPDRLAEALDWALGIAQSEGKPIVFLANFGSNTGPTDGTSQFARTIDARFGAGREGRVFITGTGDDGGMENHASAAIAQGQTVEIGVQKGEAGNLRMDLWYEGGDRFDVEVVTPSGTFSYPAPQNGVRDTRTVGGSHGFAYYHNGTGTVFFGTTNGKREVLIDFSGQTGAYAVRLTGASITEGGVFHAAINPSRIFAYGDDNRLSGPAVTAGSSIWDGATATSNIAPNSYVHAPTWEDIDGITRNDVGNDVGPGSLWPGSSIGPTFDGRLGTTVSVPGNTNIGAYAARSYFATFRSVLVEDGPNPYGTLGAVSGAAPVLTGIVALMLEADPTLDADEVRSILQTTAREDAFTGPTPNPEWGHGKVDALAAVDAVLAGTPTEPTPTASGLTWTVASTPSAHPRVALAVAASETVRVSVHDALGREVARLHDGPLAASASWTLPALPSGAYAVRAVTPEGVSVRWVTVAR